MGTKFKLDVATKFYNSFSMEDGTIFCLKYNSPVKIPGISLTIVDSDGLVFLGKYDEYFPKEESKIPVLIVLEQFNILDTDIVAHDPGPGYKHFPYFHFIKWTNRKGTPAALYGLHYQSQSEDFKKQWAHTTDAADVPRGCYNMFEINQYSARVLDVGKLLFFEIYKTGAIHGYKVLAPSGRVCWIPKFDLVAADMSGFLIRA